MTQLRSTRVTSLLWAQERQAEKDFSFSCCRKARRGRTRAERVLSAPLSPWVLFFPKDTEKRRLYYLGGILLMEGACPDLGEAGTGARAAGMATGDAGPAGDRAVEQKGVEDGALAGAAGWASLLP